MKHKKIKFSENISVAENGSRHDPKTSYTDIIGWEYKNSEKDGSRNSTLLSFNFLIYKFLVLGHALPLGETFQTSFFVPTRFSSTGKQNN